MFLTLKNICKMWLSHNDSENRVWAVGPDRVQIQALTSNGLVLDMLKPLGNWYPHLQNKENNSTNLRVPLRIKCVIKDKVLIFVKTQMLGHLRGGKTWGVRK